jgi:hypothetical protein
MPYQFRDVQFMSAAEKAATLRAWMRFLKGGLQFGQFTKGLYHHLIQHCNLVAHYNRAQFYGHYFEDGDATALFLSQFDVRGPCLPVEYGGRYWLTGDYDDLNRAMVAEAATFIPALIEAARGKQCVADIAAATALLTRHGLCAPGTLAKESRVCTPARETSQEMLPYPD